MSVYFVAYWVKMDGNRAGTGRTAIGHCSKLPKVEIPSVASRESFRANTTISMLSVAGSTLSEHNPGSLIGVLICVAHHNRHLSARIVNVGRLQTDTVRKGLMDNVPNMSANTKESKRGGGAYTPDNEVSVAPKTQAWRLWRQSPTGLRGKGMRPWGTVSASSRSRMLSMYCACNHSSETRVGGPTLWHRHPVVYPVSAPNSIQVPLLWRLRCVRHFEAVVLGPKAVENTEPQTSQAAGHLVLRAVESQERFDRLKSQYEARTWAEWMPIFNDTFPSPDCPIDTRDQRVLQPSMVADVQDVATQNLAKPISTGYVIYAEVDWRFPLRSNILVVGDYVGVTRYKRQHLRGNMRNLLAGLLVFGAIERDITEVDGSQG